jgi:hypothetical protein
VNVKRGLVIVGALVAAAVAAVIVLSKDARPAASEPPAAAPAPTAEAPARVPAPRPTVASNAPSLPLDQLPPPPMPTAEEAARQPDDLDPSELVDQVQPGEGHVDPGSGTLVVQAAPNASAEDVEASLARHGLVVLRRYEGLIRIGLPEGADPTELLAAIGADPALVVVP